MGGVLALNTLGTTVSTVSTSWYGGGVPISTGGGGYQLVRGGGVPVDSRVNKYVKKSGISHCAYNVLR